MKLNRRRNSDQDRLKEGKSPRIKRSMLILSLGALIGLMAASCGNPLMSGSRKVNGAEPVSAALAGARSLGGYCNTVPFISGEARDYYNNGYLEEDYLKWRDSYVIGDGKGNFRVTRDGSSNYDTVSEGIGYGMLLAVYFNDQNRFDGLYNYAKNHFVSSSIPLMHWKVDKDGNNVSEYADYKVDSTIIPAGSWDGRSSVSGMYCFKSMTATVPHGIVYGNLTDGSVYILPESLDQYWTVVKANLDQSANYYAMDKYKRGMSSATDADQDIAAALCFASKVWPGGSTTGVDYSTEASNMIKAIKTYDFSSDGFIKNGNAWGGTNGWNPSYFAPAYYLNVFAKQCPDQASFWQKAYDTMYSAMTSVALSITGGHSSILNLKAFFPDWCDTSAGGFKQATTISDRLYFNNAQAGQDAHANSPNGPMYYPMCAAYQLNNATTKDQYKLQQLSFNSYYDAIRVPWRIATDLIWNDTGTAQYKANEILTPLYNAYQEKWNFGNNPENLLDGYTPQGGAWDWSKRDGFNYGEGGKYTSTTFYSMAACTWFTLGNTAYNSAEWNTVKTTSDYRKPFNYYGNTLRLLSMVMLTGQFVDLYTTKVVTIKSKTLDKYVCAADSGAGQLVADRDNPAYWETFYLVDLGGGQVALKSQVNGMYVCADDGAHDNNGFPKLIANRPWDTPGQWETFDLINNSDGSVSFKAHTNNLYVCADYNVDNKQAPLAASRSAIGDWEKFYIKRR